MWGLPHKRPPCGTLRPATQAGCVAPRGRIQRGSGRGSTESRTRLEYVQDGQHSDELVHVEGACAVAVCARKDALQRGVVRAVAQLRAGRVGGGAGRGGRGESAAGCHWFPGAGAVPPDVAANVWTQNKVRCSAGPATQAVCRNTLPSML